MHRPLGRNLRIHKRFSTRIAIRGFSPRTQFVGLRFSECVLTTLRCILPTSNRAGLVAIGRQENPHDAGAGVCRPVHFQLTNKFGTSL
jgi:hypothetical protein